MNVAALFDLQARATPDAPAIIPDWGESGERGALSYRALREQSRRMATMLACRGISCRDRVAILLPNSAEFAIALLGVLWRGATAAVLSPAWAPPDANRALDRADARVLVTTRAIAESLGIPADSALLIDGFSAGGAAGRRVAKEDASSDGAPQHRDDADAATILFSSGTTGDPKGVVLTHGNLAFNAWSKIRYCGIAPGDRLAMVVPMAHCFGQNVVLLGALLAGASVRIFPRFDAERVHRAIAAGEVSMLLAAPPAFQRLLALNDDAGLRKLRYALAAAAPLSAELAEHWSAATGRRLAQGYGLTECSPFATYDDAVAPGAGVGHAIAGVEVRICAPDGDEWAVPHSPGEIVVRGPNVMQGYWRAPEATARALRGGWLRTGDFGTMRFDGTVELIDRLDDVINVGGFKAWPSDVERVIGAHASVREVAAYAVPDAVRGATVGVAIVLEPGTTLDIATLEEFARGRLAGFQRPTELRVVDSLPRSASGKVLRRMLIAGPLATVSALP
jgi:long-chain acyl-CoA synthetase